MGQYVRGEDDFEYKYRLAACLCDLEQDADVGSTEIYPQLVFCEVNDGDDLVFILSGENDCIPVDENETPFEAFRDFFISIKKYFDNADTPSLLEILEEESGMDDENELLKLMNAAENVVLSAGCYYSLTREEWPRLLEWLNQSLDESEPLALTDLSNTAKVTSVTEVLSQAIDDDDDELPLLGFLILKDAVQKDLDECIVHDLDEVWMSPVLQDGDPVTPDTEIGEFDDYMF